MMHGVILCPKKVNFSMCTYMGERSGFLATVKVYPGNFFFLQASLKYVMQIPRARARYGIFISTLGVVWKNKARKKTRFYAPDTDG